MRLAHPPPGVGHNQLDVLPQLPRLLVDVVQQFYADQAEVDPRVVWLEFILQPPDLAEPTEVEALSLGVELIDDLECALLPVLSNLHFTGFGAVGFDRMQDLAHRFGQLASLLCSNEADLPSCRDVARGVLVFVVPEMGDLGFSALFLRRPTFHPRLTPITHN